MPGIPKALHSPINTAFPNDVCLIVTVLPDGGIARFYGTARVFKSGPVYEEVWTRLIQPEKDRDPDKKGFAVLIAVERAEALDGTPLGLD
jgi:hypothetical protein